MELHIGKKVRVRSWKDMATAFPNNRGVIFLTQDYFLIDMAKYCGKLVTIKAIHEEGYDIEEDGNRFNWTNEMFEQTK